MVYVVTTDWYTEEEGYKIEVACVTHDERVAYEAFERETVNCSRAFSEYPEWAIIDDEPDLYCLAGTKPEYCRVKMHMEVMQ